MTDIRLKFHISDLVVTQDCHIYTVDLISRKKIKIKNQEVIDMKKLIVIGILVMGMSAFASGVTKYGVTESESTRLSRPLMIDLFGDYGNR